MRRSFLALLLAASLPAVQAAEYHIDPSHTYASFEIDHLGFSTQRGLFTRSSGSIEFDPEQISFDDLLAAFFSSHDPTTLNRQGHDVGTQYRSVIVAQDSAQYEAALSCIAALNDKGLFDKPVVTEVLKKMPFHQAEEYHQDYFTRHPEQGYCAVVIGPKLARFRAQFASRLKPT